MGDKIHENSILPNLDNDISGEQLVLQQKVFRKNEAFIRVHSGIVKWLTSPENEREYPVEFKWNKNPFRKRVQKYWYNERNKVLYRCTEGHDGIGMFVIVLHLYNS